MKNVVITGSARGFGFEMAKCFRQNGFNVVLSDLNMENLFLAKQKLEEEIKNDAKILTIKADVTNLEELENLWNESKKELNTIDYWINNAGVNQPEKPIYELSKKEIDLVLNVDLHGAIYGSKVAFKNMKEQGFGQIFNVEGYGSNDAIMLGLSIYGTSKRAVTYFTEALANESKELKLDIKVGRLSPGIMITDFITSANGKKGEITLSEKTKKVYNILGDYPDVIAKFLVNKMIKNNKNDVQFNWLTNSKAFFRFMGAGFSKRDFFKEN